MIKSSKKIAIIGNSGSGKTTLAFLLQKKLNLPLYHLDQYAWEPNWERKDLLKLYSKHEGLCKQEQWIIEGSYLNLLPSRIAQAETIIFLDLPRYRCVWNVLKRAVIYHGKIIPGNPEGCKQQIFNLKFYYFLKWIWNFKNKHREKVMELLKAQEHNNSKQIVILTSKKMVTLFMRQLDSELF